MYLFFESWEFVCVWWVKKSDENNQNHMEVCLWTQSENVGKLTKLIFWCVGLKWFCENINSSRNVANHWFLISLCSAVSVLFRFSLLQNHSDNRDTVCEAVFANVHLQLINQNRIQHGHINILPFRKINIDNSRVFWPQHKMWTRKMSVHPWWYRAEMKSAHVLFTSDQMKETPAMLVRW